MQKLPFPMQNMHREAKAILPFLGAHDGLSSARPWLLNCSA
jgi:hypothetical protein